MQGPVEIIIMDTFEIQRRIFKTAAAMLLVSVILLNAVIPGILQDTSPGSLPVQAAIGTFIGMSIHLLVFFGFLRGLRLTRHKHKVNREIYMVSAFGLIVLGFVIMDGAFAFLNQVLYVSIGMFLCVLCDFAAGLVSFSALILLRKKKKKQAD